LAGRRLASSLGDLVNCTSHSKTIH
jgi:hypothetical protein